ncbi:dna-directed rna polymerases i ii and iii subunit rpabc2 [Holotrichia oblita]|uniref:Dna-directed rna polymerases i ii and iii subunit rpabc2 n=1 Tax=Holotrichia oblita TaxID=644536 RepID=A0ACB9TN23_HOLOL|nr:dna-directed rna polymerases i ii and iii subunit rpabc2 [Holotrichia oblita]
MDDEHRKTRKRGMVHPEDYQRSVIKRSRVKGQEYINYKGNVVRAKSIGENCKCKRKCFEKIVEADRLTVFNRLYGLASKDEQDIYLEGLLSFRPVKRRRKQTEEFIGSKRNCSFSYCVLVNSETKVICKKAFINMHAISNKRLQRIQQLLAAGITPHDKRGHNISANIMEATEKIRVHEHIALFPIKEAHYASKDYRYLDSSLTVKTMYTLFKDKFSTSRITYEYYNKTFREDFNLKFGRQQVDTCCTCEALNIKIKSKNLNDNAKRVAAAEMIVHKRRSKQFYRTLQDVQKRCKENDNVVGLAFDYMQNLQLPKIPVQDLFYLRQLTVSVFCIHNIKTDEVVYFIHHEGNAKKGPNEVCSYIYRYIQQYIPNHVKELHLFCDNCPGQNKNNTVSRMCLFLKDSGRFDSIDQYFPIRGHSFLPCDRDFGHLKRKLKRFDRVHTLHQYIELIASANSKHKATIHVVEGNDIINFKDWWRNIYKSTAVSVETTKVPKDKRIPFNISTYHHFSYHIKDGKGVVVARTFINAFVTHTFVLSISENLSEPFGKAYPAGKIPITTEKMDHIKKSAKFVEDCENVEEFWNSIFEWPTTTN